MKTFATKEKQSAPAARKARSYVHHPMGPAQQAQRAEIRRILRSTGAQARLTIGQPNDKYEQEADRVAEQVMRMSDADVAQRQPENEEEEETVQAKPLADQITPLVQRREEPPDEEEEQVQAKFKDGEMLQRTCPECEKEQSLQSQPEEEEEELQAKSKTGETPTVTPDLESRIRSLKSSGQPLSESARSYFEPRFGRDFGRVRLHTDSRSAETAQAIKARAFTTGRDVAFGRGQYSPETTTGKKLLAHELTHVVQQSDELQRELPREPSGKPIVRKVNITNKQAHQIMREVWSPQDSPPPCNSSPIAIQQEHHVELGPVPARTENCVFTPLFHVPIGTSSVQVIASAVSPPPGEWRINVFECPWRAARGNECRHGRGDNAAFGSISDSLSVNYDPILWISRNLFIRIRNGSSMSPISNVRLTLRVRPITLDSIGEIIHTALEVLGLIPALGVIPDAANAGFYLIEGNWIGAGISAAAMVPIFGQGAGITRLGVRVSRASIERLGREGVETAIREGVERAGTRVLRRAPPGRIIAAMRGFRSRTFRAGSETFQLDSRGMQHILARHHPRYWDGSVRQTQSFLDEHLSVDDVADAIIAVLSQNRQELIRFGTRRPFQVTGFWGGVRYAVGLNPRGRYPGRVGQFFPI